ncbi:50S ribosomal protein L35 [Brevibacillus choshinensis]|jgi:large subunit ribosomal protein L35|uniref:Large ribosomal subunit protein bL35 n=1 Tax=Brevibacillus choshinensis TaxID=54911 RepID=A0ABR5NAL9_BRECH|nr:50S ribosomal protein L35 [Brevibacillus choshinensis]KQL48600.1 50S ribosomal protein L35 [Brevibacillus choshinensis]MED4585127.1 50S ribosomal protein L35 [Brevibacillus choshinensis]MED4753787.1 50S ribosomal protein L35 [Brevibacillus choshinensis]MED4781781.1 50S ribosomal protein L35 [Brevibacillus choshinensis]
MPKMKTNKAAAKRFKKTGSGQLKRDRAFGSHLFANKSTKAKRHLRKASLVSKGDQKRMEQMLTYL